METEWKSIPLSTQGWWKKNYNAKGFNVEIPIFKTGEKGPRLLFVMDRVHIEDIKNKRLLGTNVSKVLFNCLDYLNQPVSEVAAINLHCFRTKPLTEEMQTKALKEFWNRIESYITSYKPDCVLLCGTESPALAFPNLKYNHVLDLGRRKHFFIKDEKYKAVISLPYIDISTTRSDEINSSPSLIGEFARHIDTAINGNRYNINDPFETIVIDNLKKFKDFMVKLRKADVVALDTEFTAFSRYKNTLLSIQFSFDGKISWFLPYHHNETPWTPKELEYIKEKLKDYCENGKSKHWYVQNGKTEINIFKNHLDVRFINHKLYDCQGGSFSLDENRKFLSNLYNVKPQSLEALSHMYGFTQYQEGVIGKEDRDDMGKYSLKNLIEYGSKDPIATYRVAECQIQEAKRRKYKNFVKMVTGVISDMTYCFGEMERNGVRVDKQYLIKMMAKNSPFTQAIDKVKDKFKKSKFAQEANRRLLKTNAPGQSLFGDPWVFDIAKRDCAQSLFFDVMNLTPLNQNENGGSVDKAFQEEYASFPEVQYLTEYNKNTKLKSTFIKAHLDRLSKDLDAKIDSCIRAFYGFVGVLTGRTSASKPNLQQIPSRGKLSKLVKRQFVALLGYIFLKMDYRAQEVAQWANISKDKKLIGAFTKGTKIRRNIRILDYKYNLEDWFHPWAEQRDWFNQGEDKKPLVSIEKKRKQANKLSGLKNKYANLQVDLIVYGDPHRLNYQFFFGVAAQNVTDDQRQNVKSVIFGTIYGKGARALAYDICKKAMEAIDRKARGIKEFNEDQREEWANVKKKSHFKQAQDLIDKLFDTFKEGGEWIHNIHKIGRSTYHLVSPLFRVRHMWGYMHQSNQSHAAMDRRGPNSLVQGFSSDIPYIGGRRLQEAIWKRFIKKGKEFSLLQMNAVHDSSELTAKILDLPESLYLLEHAMTSMVHRELKYTYGFEFSINLEIEMEVGFDLSHMSKWDYTTYGLKQIIKEQLEYAKKEHGYNVKKEIIDQMWKKWDKVKLRRLKELELIDGNVEYTKIKGGKKYDEDKGESKG